MTHTPIGDHTSDCRRVGCPDKFHEIMYRFFNKNDAHLHQLQVEGEWKDLTGTTTIVDVLGKPLTWWASGKAVETMGWLKPERDKKNWKKILNQDERLKKAEEYLAAISEYGGIAYLALLDKAYKAHNENKKETAEAGTDMHAELEKYVRLVMAGKPPKTTKHQYVKDFALWARKNVKRFVGSEVCCYSEKLWVGGITDLVMELVNGDWAIGDFKSSKEAYFSQFVQEAGYDIQLSENGAFDKEGNKLFDLEKPIKKYIIFPFGAAEFAPTETVLTNSLKDTFGSLVVAYRAKALFEGNQ